MPDLILLADGDGKVARALSSALEAAGYKVLTAGNGREAHSLLSHMQEGIDLLVTDIDLPGMSGVELAVNSTRCRAACPVLLISAQPAPPEAQLGGWDYLCKPFDGREFVEVVDAILRRPNTQAVGNNRLTGD